jgi:Leucine rich repeat
MTDQTNSIPRPWRRYLRFSLRGLIVVVLVVGAEMGWLVRSSGIQREAVAAIEQAGGRAAYNWERVGQHGGTYGEPRAPRWLTDLIGVDYFGHITKVWLGKSGTNAQIALVARLDRVERLDLSFTRVSDAGLVHLKRMTNLSKLHLWGTEITDAGLVHLKGMTNLTALSLGNTRVTDAGMVHLKGLRNLSILFVSNTRVTDAGIDELKQALPSLKIYH